MRRGRCLLPRFQPSPFPSSTTHNLGVPLLPSLIPSVLGTCAGARGSPRAPGVELALSA